MASPFASSRLASRSFKATAADKSFKAATLARSIKQLWFLIAGIVLALFLVRTIRFLLTLFFRRRPDSSSSEKSEKVSPESTLQNGRKSWRRLPVALASVFRVIAFRIRVPLGFGSAACVAELLFIWGYIAAMLALTLANSHNLQYWFFEDRAAHLAACQLPFIVALAGKNNVISFFTGIGHEKLNVLHRAAGRACLILLWIHALARTLSGLSPKSDFTHDWMRWGAVALAAITLATIFSLRFVRNALFELFLLAHIALVGVFLIGCFMHAREVQFGDYIWPAMVLWAFDRCLRGARILWNNSGRIASKHQHAVASVELVSSDTVRLTLRRNMNWLPGQHAYVILPTISGIPTEAHPFTIGSIPKALDGTEGSSEKEVVFLIRGRNGFTARLREHAMQGPSSLPAFIDGPYGCPPDLTKYTTCILFAGGSGISYTLPLLLDLVQNARAQTSCVRRVIFVWAVRDSEHLNWICRTLNEAISAARGTPLAIEPAIFVTGRTFVLPHTQSMGYTSSDGDSAQISLDSQEDKPDLPSYSPLKITHGRPSLRRILQDGIETSPGPVSVDVAGPAGLHATVAHILSSDLTGMKNVLKGAPSVTLHVESFGMTR